MIEENTPMNSKQQIIKFGMMGIILSLFLITGCTNLGRDRQEDKQEETSKDMTQSKEELKKKLNQAIDNADKKIAELEAQAASASEDVKQQLNAAISGIQKERQKVINQAEKVANASESTWEDIKKESDVAMKNASQAYDSLSNKVSELVQ